MSSSSVAGQLVRALTLVAARAGLSVVLLERGPFPGSKNMYGGVVYPSILDELIPDWWEEAPIQRWVTRRSTMLLTETQALTVDSPARKCPAVQRCHRLPTRLRQLVGLPRRRRAPS